MYLGTFVAEGNVWFPVTNGQPPPPTSATACPDEIDGGWNSNSYQTFRVQFKDAGGNWETYDEKYVQTAWAENMEVSTTVGTGSTGSYAPGSISVSGNDPTAQLAPLGDQRATSFWDPRTPRFGAQRLLDNTTAQGSTGLNGFIAATSPGSGSFSPTPTPNANPTTGSVDPTNNVLLTIRSANAAGVRVAMDAGLWGAPGYPNLPGWTLGGTAAATWTGSTPGFAMGQISQNLSSSDTYYSDADGQVRRAMGAYTTTDTVGLPMATAAVSAAAATQSQSRPIVLNRPFQSVAELGHVFSGTPWKNLNFFTPESGDGGLLDVFCISETNPSAMVAGKVNLNTQQPAVLQAIFSGAYEDALSSSLSSTTPTATANLLTPGASGEAAALASKLVARTANGAQPLQNLGDVVGRWNSSTSTYDGFSADVTAVLTALSPQPANKESVQNIQRMRESSIRALAACGQTRVWNLMIDVVSQTGRYPSTASSVDNFVVDAEKRLWVHVAIDRLTGQILDEQIEPVQQ